MKNIITPFIALSLSTIAVIADNVINDDLIVTMSACIGNDCSNGESFGFETLRLKENNLRIGFTDTSTSASFPGNDWQITINDSDNGGANKFSIDDITGGKTPFTIEASAPSNSLYVDSNGYLGLGTAAPVVELHVVDGDTTALRLEQDGSSGFTAQTWDVAGNESNFFVRDVTHSSKLPFRIVPNSPGDSLYIKTDKVYLGNDVEVGKTNSNKTLTVYGDTTISGTATIAESATINTISTETSDITTALTLSSNNTAGYNSDVGLSLINAKDDFTWVVRTLASDGSFSISKNKSGGKELIVSGLVNGAMSLTLGNGASNNNGQWLDASSRAYKENIKDLDETMALEAFEALQPVTYNYKADKTEGIVGFIAEDVPSIVAVKDRNALSSLEMVALLTKVVQVKNKEMESMKKEIKSLQQMQIRMNQMESMISNLAREK